MMNLITLSILWTAALVGGPEAFQIDWITIHDALCKASGRNAATNVLKVEKGKLSVTVFCVRGKGAPKTSA